MNVLRALHRVPFAAPRVGLFLLLALAGAESADSVAADWHAAGWTQRAVVAVTRPDGGGDVAAVNVLHEGRAAAEGKDYRIYDSAGQPVPYEVTYHHPARDSWISFRAPSGQKDFAIYYGKPDAAVDPQRAMPAPLGKGPPSAGAAAGGWIPRSGLMLTTMRRNREADNPKSVPQMLELIAKSPGLDGAGYRSAIAESFNPFGDSDYYISVYRGWIEIPAAGDYGFCTVSNEASFSFLDGKNLADWPGRHTEQRGKHGEYNATAKLAAGPHYVEYLQEEVLLYQLAYLGYRPPGSEPFIAIPEAMFPLPRAAAVARYEQADGKRSVEVRPELVDNVWPKEQSGGQFTRYHFTADAGSDVTDWQGWTLDWDFGDGITASGPSVDHVFLRNGDYPVKLTASAGDGSRIEAAWPLVVFPIEHLGGPYREGRIEDYVPIVERYDAGRLQAALLGELVRFLAASDQHAAAEKLAETMLARPDLENAARSEAHLMLAGDAGLAQAVWDAPVPHDRVAKIVEHLQAAIPLLVDPTAKVRAMARLVRVQGVEQHDVAAASALYGEGQKLAQPTQGDRAKPAALRDLHLAMGDALLVARSPGKAASAYREAEQLVEAPIPPAVRAAKIGAYPENLAQQVAAKNLDDARAVVREWIEEFPADQARGTSLFWLGKIEQLRGKPAASLRPLQLAVVLTEGSDVEAEARWLLAETYRQLGDTGKQREALEALVTAGLTGPYREKALAALGKK